VTCQFCHSSLEVKHTENATFTEEIGKIAENTERIVAKLERIERHHAEEVREREAERAEFRGIHGPVQRMLGALAGSVFMLIFTAFGIFFAMLSSSTGAPAIFGVFGLGFAVIGVIGLISVIKKALSGRSGSGD